VAAVIPPAVAGRVSARVSAIVARKGCIGAVSIGQGVGGVPMEVLYVEFISSVNPQNGENLY
jgi:hypothetical protein